MNWLKGERGCAHLDGRRGGDRLCSRGHCRAQRNWAAGEIATVKRKILLMLCMDSVHFSVEMPIKDF